MKDQRILMIAVEISDSVALVMTRGNVTQASKRLGVHRNTLHGRLRRRLVADIDRVAIIERTRRRR